MSLIETLKSVVSAPGDGADTTKYECQECGHTFESAKSPERVQCIECLSRDTEQL